MENKAGFDSFRAWSTLAVVIVGTFLSAISSTTISVALPTIMNVFGTNLDGVQWITTVYALVMAIVIPLTPYLSKVFSSERVYIAALFIFTVFSTLCAFSTSLNMMLFFRIMQAIGGGMMAPIGMGMVIALFPVEKRGLAFGVFGIAAMAAPAFGPTIGGYIVQYFGWEYIFYLNLPFGIIAVILALKFFKFGERAPFPRFDIAGFISAALASSLLLYLLGKNQNLNWHDPIYTYMVIIGVGALIFFIANELFSESPLLDLRLLKNRNFSASLFITMITSLVLMGISYTMPVFLQNFRGLTAMESGVVLLPSTLVMALIMPIAGKITDLAGVRGTKWIIAGGIILCSMTTFMISELININSSITSIIILTSIRNIGLGLFMMPARTLGLIEITHRDSQKATSLSTFVTQFASSISVAFVTLVISTQVNVNLTSATSQLTPFNIPFTDTIKNLAANFVSHGLSAEAASSQALTVIYKQIYTENYVLAIQYAVFVTAVIGLVALIVVPLFKSKNKVMLSEE